MKLIVNGYTIESDDPANVISAAIRSFGDNPELESVRHWALSEFANLKAQQQNQAGITEAMYYEAKRWQEQSGTSLNLNPGNQTPAAYAAWVVTTWDKIEADYRLAVSLINQAKNTDEIQIIMTRRF